MLLSDKAYTQPSACLNHWKRQESRRYSAKAKPQKPRSYDEVQ